LVLTFFIGVDSRMGFSGTSVGDGDEDGRAGAALARAAARRDLLGFG
jgi:hypothetical protein